MDDARIRSLIIELDRLVPRDGAIIRPGEFFTEIDAPAMTGNRLGYLRIGVELMKIADLPPTPSRPERIKAEMKYLIDPNDSTGEFATFERRENLRLWQEELAERTFASWKQRLLVLLVGGAGIVVLLALVLGFIQIARFLGV